MTTFAGGQSNLKRIKYFDLPFCHRYFLTKPNIFAKFERNPAVIELYHFLPGFLMDTLLIFYIVEKVIFLFVTMP